MTEKTLIDTQQDRENRKEEINTLIENGIAPLFVENINKDGKRGRKKIQFTEEMYRVFQLSLYNGYTHQNIADLLRIPLSTLDKIIKRDKRLREIKAAGTERMGTWLLGKLVEGINNGSERLLVFAIKNKLKWTDDATVNIIDPTKAVEEMKRALGKKTE